MSDQSIRIIQKWLKRCEIGHPSCRVLTTRGPQDGRQNILAVLPTRVIRVGSADEKKVNLYETFGQFGRHTALSHRWLPGKTPKWVTTKKNADKRQKGFSIRELPKSIRDAIQVTRKLGLKYLWIDSLCILQDSTEDWDIESSRMVDMYSHAHVTLFADGARDDDAGFLGPRKFADHKPLAVRLKVQHGGAVTLPVFIRISVDGSRQDFKSTVDESVLSSRGWILQERLMSRRILHFGKEQICWECRTMVDQEDGLVLPDEREWLRGIHNELLGHNETTDTKNWRRIAEVYSQCQLTKHCDKLPALSGIASAVSAVRKGDIYLAGLWKNSLALDLAWKTEWTKSMAPTEYRAPSWSWASIDGRIEYWDTPRWKRLENLAVAFDVTEARVEYQGKNLFGHVRDGSLTLSGLLVEVSCLGPYSEWLTPLYVGGTPVGSAYFDLGAFFYSRTVTCFKLLDTGTLWDEVFLVLIPFRGHFRRIGLGDTCLGAGSRYLSQSIFAKSTKQTITIL